MKFKKFTRMFWNRYWPVVKNTSGCMIASSTVSLAAELAFFCMFALFPFLIFLGWMSGHFIKSGGEGAMLAKLELFLPSYVSPLVMRNMHNIFYRPPEWLGIITLVMSLWGASVAVSSLMSAINNIYGIADRRPYWARKSVSLVLTLALELVIMLGIMVLVVGPVVREMLISLTGFYLFFNFVFGWYRWVIALGMMIICLFLLYRFGPGNRRKVRVALPGAVFTIIGWFTISEGFKFYFSRYAHYTLLYGTLSGIIVLMTWFYLLGAMVITGAQLNRQLMSVRLGRLTDGEDSC
ncbi:MAG: YihY/virulence factor BrkB family protein [Elusimicrobiaceae bacterium]|nr:YihY/virulence factor BrkB family protein [Elusimicrobiaceae bacterium]